jgi:methylmalonyl-CoA mutase C-terminal domain/subunit
MSLLNGAHGTLFPRVVRALKKKNINDVLIVGGGVIPDMDHKDLIKSGVDHVFGPGTPLPTIIDHITDGVSKLRKI